MMHNAWSSIEEVPYCFARSSIEFMVTRAEKLTIWIQFEITRPVAAIKSLRFALFAFSHPYVPANNGDIMGSQASPSNPWPHLIESGSVWSMDQGSYWKSSAVFNFAPTDTTCCDIQEVTKWQCCRCSSVFQLILNLCTMPVKYEKIGDQIRLLYFFIATSGPFY